MYKRIKMSKITLQRNQDNGYGVVSCIQKQDFDLNNIHEYFKSGLEHLDHNFNFDEPYKDIDSVVSFLKENWDVCINGCIMEGLDDTDIAEYFLSTCNPNGGGNSVDCLVLTYNGKVLFES